MWRLESCRGSVKSCEYLWHWPCPDIVVPLRLLSAAHVTCTDRTTSRPVAHVLANLYGTVSYCPPVTSAHVAMYIWFCRSSIDQGIRSLLDCVEILTILTAGTESAPCRRQILCIVQSVSCPPWCEDLTRGQARSSVGIFLYKLSCCFTLPFSLFSTIDDVTAVWVACADS